MTTVVDASVMVAALVDSGPTGTWAESVLMGGPLASPHLAPVEVANILRRMGRTGDISTDVEALAHGDLLRLLVEFFPYLPLGVRAWELRDTVTVYDAGYVALAEELGAPLATLDARLARASGPRCRFLLPPAAELPAGHSWLTEGMTATTDAPTTSAASLVAALRATYRSGVTRPLAWRRRQLGQLARMLEENEAAFLEALKVDLGKSPVEGYITDIAFVLSEIEAMVKHLARWNRPKRVLSPLVTLPARSKLIPQPLGVVLVIAPWNYPVQLLLAPVAGAIAAGNTVVMKPSEVSAATSALLARLVPEYLDPSAIALVEGGVPETTALLAERFDHIFYTGNGAVGRVVMAAAARHLTPVTLELGGKSPVIVDRSANLRVTARRVAWGKWLNAGQTCIAPDYVLVHEEVRDRFLEELAEAVTNFYGTDPHTSPDYGRIVTDRHFDRLAGLMASGTVAVGGRTVASERYIAPTVLVDVDPSSPIMQEEIFGPLLPVLTVASARQAVDLVNERDHPLALYVFAGDRAVVDDVLARTASGGVTVNGTMLHFTNPHLPFGGIGESGMGGYHGESGVRLFQHLKPVLTRGTALDPSLPYPPYNDRKARIFRRIL